MPALRDDDAGFFALQFVGAGELVTERFDEAAGARAAFGAEQALVRRRNSEPSWVKIASRGSIISKRWPVRRL